MSKKLESIFFDNPGLTDELSAFCATIPEYVQAEQRFQQITMDISKTMDFDTYDRFERGLWDYIGRLADAYYLFGLGLRQEVMAAMLK